MIPKYKFKPAIPRPLRYSGASESPEVGEVEWKCTDVQFQNCVGSPIAQLERELLCDEQEHGYLGPGFHKNSTYRLRFAFGNHAAEDVRRQNIGSGGPGCFGDLI